MSIALILGGGESKSKGLVSYIICVTGVIYSAYGDIAALTCSVDEGPPETVLALVRGIGCGNVGCGLDCAVDLGLRFLCNSAVNTIDADH